MLLTRHHNFVGECNGISMIQKTNRLRLRWTLSSSNLIVSTRLWHQSVNTDYSSHVLVHKDDISREQLKELLYEEIMSFRPPPLM